jgi:phosphatidate cytidylyltransferase
MSDDESSAPRRSATARARRGAGRGTPAPGPRPSPRRRGPQPGVTFGSPAAGSAAPADVPADAADTGGTDGSAPADPPATEAPAATSRAGRNLPAAIGVGVGLGALIVASLFVYRPSFAVLVGVAVVYGCYELGQALRAADIQVALAPVIVGGVSVLVSAWVRGPSGLVLAALITFVAVLLWRIADGAFGYARDVAASSLLLLYVPTLAAFAVLLVHPSDGAARVLAFAATVVCSDTGGYATGVLFGRHPLAPIVSKAKTWEGFAGSVIACSIAGVLFLTLTFHEAWWKGLLFGLAIVVTATLGDLGESMIKRDLGIKDMGNLLPGHGGLMDRLDSLLPCAAVAYLLLSAFAPV